MIQAGKESLIDVDFLKINPFFILPGKSFPFNPGNGTKQKLGTVVTAQLRMSEVTTQLGILQCLGSSLISIPDFTSLPPRWHMITQGIVSLTHMREIHTEVPASSFGFGFSPGP